MGAELYVRARSLHGHTQPSPSGHPLAALPLNTSPSLPSHVLSSVPCTGHRRSPSSPAHISPLPVLPTERTPPGQGRQGPLPSAGSEPPGALQSPPVASSWRASPKVLTAIGEMAQQIATINNLLIFINIQISKLQKLKGGDSVDGEEGCLRRGGGSDINSQALQIHSRTVSHFKQILNLLVSSLQK